MRLPWAAGPLPVLRMLGYDILRITEGGETSVIRVSPRMEGANMGKAGGVGLIVIGALMGLLGILLLASGWFDWLLDVMGFILLAIGVIAAVVGVVQMASGRGSSMDF